MDLFGVSNHSIELFNASNSLWRLLEEALSNICHNSLVLSDFGGDSDKGAELRRKVNILPLLTNFEERLVH